MTQERWRTVMVLSISVVFVVLYVAAVAGWWELVPNKDAIAFIQPVVWVIIGYYFGRVPGERTESRLKEQADKSAAAEKAATKKASDAQARLVATETRLAAARTVLREGATAAIAPGGVVTAAGGKPGVSGPATSHAALALRILSEETTPPCLQCVLGAIEDWAGSELNGMEDVLKDLYLPKHGACDNGALRDLCDLLKQRCAADISASDLRCGMTVGDVVQVVCG